MCYPVNKKKKRYSVVARGVNLIFPLTSTHQSFDQFAFERGSIFGLVEPSGSGKTSLLKCLIRF